MSPPNYQPRSPDFIGIGAQKAGTSWLDAHLRRVPGVWMPPAKEIHYFDRGIPWAGFPSAQVATRLADPDWRLWAAKELHARASREQPDDLAWWTRYHLGDIDDAWYRSLFAEAPAQAVAGEITPQYALCGREAIAHMHAVAPKAKIILQLRNPVDRFWSQCQMNQGRRILSSRAEDILAFFDSPRGHPRGDYASTLLNFAQVFDPSAILLVFFDAIPLAPAQLLTEVADFLGIALNLPQSADLPLKVNASPLHASMPEEVRAAVARRYADGLHLLANTLGGYASKWCDEAGSLVAAKAAGTGVGPPTLRLTAAHVQQLRAATGTLNG